MSDRLEFVIQEVIRPKIHELEADVKELQRELARHEGRSEANKLLGDVREIRQNVVRVSRELSELKGSMEGVRYAMTQSEDVGLAEAAKSITINVQGGEATSFGGDLDTGGGDAVIGDQTK